jgi:hypothetical protein
MIFQIIVVINFLDQENLYLLTLLHVFLYNQYIKNVVVNYSL